MSSGDETGWAEAGSVGAETIVRPPWPDWPAALTAGYLVFLFAVIGLAMELNIAADRAGAPGLAFLNPLFTWILHRGVAVSHYAFSARAIAPGVGVCL